MFYTYKFTGCNFGYIAPVNYITLHNRKRLAATLFYIAPVWYYYRKILLAVALATLLQYGIITVNILLAVVLATLLQYILLLRYHSTGCSTCYIAPVWYIAVTFYWL